MLAIKKEYSSSFMIAMVKKSEPVWKTLKVILFTREM